MALVVVAMAGSAMAATTSSNFNVTASVTASCRIITANNLAFGAYDPTDPLPLDVSTSTTYQCVKNTTATYYITPGSGSRAMTAVDTLNYELYSDVAGGAIFPSTNPTGLTNTPANNGLQTVNIYGRIPALQNVGASAAYLQVATFNIDF